ncbi:hypothetical protein [Spiroplasma endosymbiont of Crioceris asparagi]|uniref:hypothetical protein n=1 Tax=Spiroplasma endosymbiont of Crioceris asparagi TaxID=3066286 RepID=UPI0030CC2337
MKKRKSKEEYGVFKNKKVDKNVSNKEKTFVVNEVEDENIKIEKSYNINKTIIDEDVVLILDSDQNKKKKKKRFFNLYWIALYILILIIVIIFVVYAINKMSNGETLIT